MDPTPGSAKCWQFNLPHFANVFFEETLKTVGSFYLVSMMGCKTFHIVVNVYSVHLLALVMKQGKGCML